MSLFLNIFPIWVPCECVDMSQKTVGDEGGKEGEQMCVRNGRKAAADGRNVVVKRTPPLLYSFKSRNRRVA